MSSKYEKTVLQFCILLLLGSLRLNIYFVVSLFDFCSFRLATLTLKSCYDLIDNFKKPISHEGFLLPSSVISYLSVSLRVGNNFSCVHVWEISLTLVKDHHEWLTLGRILGLTDLFPTSRLWLVLSTKIIQCFQLCLDVVSFRLSVGIFWCSYQVLIEMAKFLRLGTQTCLQ